MGYKVLTVYDDNDELMEEHYDGDTNNAYMAKPFPGKELDREKLLVNDTERGGANIRSAFNFMMSCLPKLLQADYDDYWENWDSDDFDIYADILEVCSKYYNDDDFVILCAKFTSSLQSLPGEERYEGITESLRTCFTRNPKNVKSEKKLAAIENFLQTINHLYEE